MFEVERNSPIETEVLAQFFTRCGWREAGAGAKLEWALATSEEWVSCRLDGEMIGFGRSCRLDVVHRVVFDALVDPRFKNTGLRAEIVRLLTENVGLLEVVSVYDERHVNPLASAAARDETEAGYFPVAPPGAYLGRQSAMRGGER